MQVARYEPPLSGQLVSAQQALFIVPAQAWHLPSIHRVLPSVQVSPAQHAWPRPPQVPHEPLLQVPAPARPAQASVSPTQTLFTQQPSPPHCPAMQQGCPLPPHASHFPTPSPVQFRVGIAQVLLAQHAWPEPPQTWQAPALQTKPAAQLWSAQHGSPGSPHRAAVVESDPSLTMTRVASVSAVSVTAVVSVATGPSPCVPDPSAGASRGASTS